MKTSTRRLWTGALAVFLALGVPAARAQEAPDAAASELAAEAALLRIADRPRLRRAFPPAGC